ncbi:ComEC/Rec2 family competence protein [Halocatena marina]|uniref:ComEC/Rec2 family competence protein n=1 Tax=Halocatena marina TaxID=2934937 RepID=UPI00200F58D4|nr:MBL fold metallo-hydrolase [Halocatena marina]
MPGEPLSNGKREVYTLNVEQADSHAIITEDGKIALIDADKERAADELDTILAGRETPQTDTGRVPIETFVLTHFHDDHSRGVQELYDHGYEIQHAIQPDEDRYTMRDRETRKPRKGVKVAVKMTYARALKKHDPDTIKQVSMGDSLSSDIDSQVLAPPSDSGTITFTSPETGRKNTLKPTGANANSIALKTEGEQSVLFMGDVEDTGGLNGESQVMHQHDSEESEVDLDADILVVSHHGSDNATSTEFLERVDPEVAVISSGLHNKHTSENQHDAHPHDATLKRLHDRGIDVYWTPGHGTLRTDLDTEAAHPEPTTDLETTNAADVAALKYYCREHDVSPEQIVALTPDHLPEETSAWVADAAPMMVESTEEILDEAIANGESVEDLRQTLDPTPDAHDQLQTSVQADRDEHVTTRADVNRNREAFFSAKRAEDAYKRLPLHTRLRANLPNRFGGIEHPLADVPSPDDIDGPRKVEEVPRAVQHSPAAKKRDKRGIVIDERLLAAEDAADEAVDTAETSETLCHHLRETPGAHQDFLYAIETPDAHTKHKPEEDLSESLEQTNQRERSQTQDVSLGL